MATLAAGAMLAAALAKAGCGESGEEPARGSDLTALPCPIVPGGDGSGYEPAEGSFDTAELIGMELAQARATAAEHGCALAVSMRDGRGRPVPIDVDPTRVYIYVEDGAVTYIEGVGGGL